MQQLSINKGSSLKKNIYLIAIFLLLALALWLHLKLDDIITVCLMMLFLLFLIPLWYFESFSYIKIMYYNNTFSVRDGSSLIHDKYIFHQNDIVKIQIKSYRENTGSSKKSGPYTYDRPFDNKTNSQSNYAVRIKLFKKAPIIFGKYISLNQFREVKKFISGNDSTTPR